MGIRYRASHSRLFFNILPINQYPLGVLIVRSRIDYERIERTQFTVRAIDNGQPQRTGTAQVFINIINTNDNSPIPSQVSVNSLAPSLPQSLPV